MSGFHSDKFKREFERAEENRRRKLHLCAGRAHGGRAELFRCSKKGTFFERPERSFFERPEHFMKRPKEWFCHGHAPSQIAKRNAARNARWDAEAKVREAGYARQRREEQRRKKLDAILPDVLAALMDCSQQIRAPGAERRAQAVVPRLRRLLPPE